jgi:hypothetical protein
MYGRVVRCCLLLLAIAQEVLVLQGVGVVAIGGLSRDEGSFAIAIGYRYRQFHIGRTWYRSLPVPGTGTVG